MRGHRFRRHCQQAVDHLAALGHRSIALLNHSKASRDNGYGPTLRAHQGYLQAMARRGLAPRTVWCEENPIAARIATAGLLDSTVDLTAMVAMNGDAVFGVVAELRNRDIALPLNLSLLSIVSSPRVAELIEPR